MLPKQNRLPTKEIKRIFEEGKNFKSRFLLLKLAPESLEAQEASGAEESRNQPQFTVVVPMKVSKKATKRNRIKRLIRESLRKKIDKARPGTKGIIMGLPHIVDKNYKEIDEEVKNLLNKSGISISSNSSNE